MIQFQYSFATVEAITHHRVRLQVEFGFCGSIVAYITRREVRTGDGGTFQQVD